MFRYRVTLFRIFGFAVRVDASWLVIAALLTWSLASGLFPHYTPGLTGGVYWVMGAAGTVGLFASVIYHELSHSLVARYYGLPITGITLFIFGGVAEMAKEPPDPRSEFYMAAAGPLASLLLGGVLYALYLAPGAEIWPSTVGGVIVYLAVINTALAVFNMVPAFPLDGGRVARALLWAWRDDIETATWIVSWLGQAFAVVLIALGLYSTLMGNLVGGVWWVLLGLFLHAAAHGSYEHLLIYRSLRGDRVGDLMRPDPTAVPAGVSVESLTDEYLRPHHRTLLPVVADGRLVGCVGSGEVKRLDAQSRSRTRVGDIMRPLKRCPRVEIDESAAEALQQLRHAGQRSVFVVDGERPVGVLTVDDVMEHLAVKRDLRRSG